MNITELLNRVEPKENTDWILKSLLENPCVTVIFKYKYLAEIAKRKYIESRECREFLCIDDAPNFTSLECLLDNGILLTMGRNVIFDNSCFL